MVGLWLGLGQNKEKYLYGWPMVRAKYLLVRVMSKIEKDTLNGWPLVRVKAKIEKTPFVVGLWLGLG